MAINTFSFLRLLFMKNELILSKESRIKVVAPENCSNVIKFAYCELARFLRESASAELVLARSAEIGAGQSFISLGDTIFSRKFAQEISFERLGSSGCILRQDNGNIVIVGATDIATLYGVYELLKIVGVEFFARDEICVLKHSRFVLRDINKVSIPSINTRHVGYYEAVTNGETASRMRVISSDMYFNDNRHEQKGEVLKGDILYGVWGGLWAHTMLKQILPVEYSGGAPLHPEYYSSDLTQVCMTNEKARQVFTENLKKLILRAPNAEYFMLGISDNNTSCMCDACRASNAQYTISGTYTRFINEVARSINEWRAKVLPNSHFTLCAFAYNEYKNPPVKKDEKGEFVAIDPSVILEDNVAIMVAPLDACGAHDIHQSCNKVVKDRFLGWKAVSSKLIVWDYHTYFDSYMLYFPSIKPYAQNIKFYKECGAKYVYNEGALYAQSSGFADLKVYLLSQLQWDCEQDEDKLIDKFFINYYKQSAQVMRKYYETLNEHFESLECSYLKRGKKGYHTAFETSWQPDVLTAFHYPLAFVKKLEKLLNSALQIAESINSEQGERLAARIKKEMLFVKYLIIEIHSYYCDNKTYNERIDEFSELCNAVKITNYRHGYGDNAELNVSNLIFKWRCRWPARVDK